MKDFFKLSFLAIVSLSLFQCSTQNILELDYVTTHATSCRVYITERSDTTTITFKNVNFIWKDEHEDSEPVLEDIRVEQPIADYIKHLCWILFVTEEYPIYDYYEFDHEQSEERCPPTWIKIIKNSGGVNENTIIDLDSYYTKDIDFTGDGYAYVYSKQFKSLMQHLDFILARHIGGEYYEDYLRELNERRENATKEVFIPDSIK